MAVVGLVGIVLMVFVQGLQLDGQTSQLYFWKAMYVLRRLHLYNPCILFEAHLSCERSKSLDVYDGALRERFCYGSA